MGGAISSGRDGGHRVVRSDHQALRVSLGVVAGAPGRDQLIPVAGKGADADHGPLEASLADGSNQLLRVGRVARNAGIHEYQVQLGLVCLEQLAGVRDGCRFVNDQAVRPVTLEGGHDAAASPAVILNK